MNGYKDHQNMYWPDGTLKGIRNPLADQHNDVRFQGKPLDDLTREEAIEALRQALAEVKSLQGRATFEALRSMQSAFLSAPTGRR